MRVLIVGAGAIGEAVARLMVLRGSTSSGSFQGVEILIGDRDLDVAQDLCKRLDDPRLRAVRVDASASDTVATLLTDNAITLLINVCGPQFNLPLMRACLAGHADYLDTASDYPTEEVIAAEGLREPLLGSAERHMHREFVAAGLRAFQGFGAVPGMAGILARSISDSHFDSVDTISVRYGGNLAMPGGAVLAFASSVADVIATCTMPATLVRDGEFTQVTAFDDFDTLELPDGAGNARFGLAEIEEVAHIALSSALLKGVRNVDFRYAPGEQLLDALAVVKALRLDSEEPISVRGTLVCPLDVLNAAAPDPREHSKEYVGSTVTGVLVQGKRDGNDRKVFAYQKADNKECVTRFGLPAVDAQTAVTPAVIVELLASGAGRDISPGIVHGPALNPSRYLELIGDYGFPAGTVLL